MSWFRERLLVPEFLTSTEIYDHTGFQNVVGIALEGKNAIAGPVVGAAVILPPGLFVKYSQQPSKLTDEECDLLSDDIKLRGTHASLGWSDCEDDTKMAIFKCVRSAAGDFSFWNPPTCMLLDGFSLEHLPNNLINSHIPLLTVQKGSTFVETIIAAQIVARCARNVYMCELDSAFPQYDFKNNKGFATPSHLKAIANHGLSPCHRSFYNDDA